MNLKIKITVAISLIFFGIITLLGYVFFITINNSMQRDIELEAEQVCQEAAYAIAKNVYSDIYVLRAAMAHSDIIALSYSLDPKIRSVQELVTVFEYEYILLIWGDEYYRVYGETYVQHRPDMQVSIPDDAETVLYGRLYNTEEDGLLIAEPARTNEDGIEYQMVIKRAVDWIYRDLVASESFNGKNIVVSTSGGWVLFPQRFEDMMTSLPEQIPAPTMEWITLNGPQEQHDLYSYSMSMGNIPLNITSFIDNNQKAGVLREQVVSYLMLAGCSIILVAAIVYLLSRHMTGAVTGLARYVENVDCVGSVPEEFTERKDEAGILARAFFSLMQRLQLTIAEKEYIAFHDKLTGLPNRYVMEEDIAELLKEGRVFAFALMDVDNFKAVNDRLGHIEGDRLLIQFADMLLHYDAKRLKAYRWGGDEFGIVLYGNTKEACRDTLDDILKETDIEYGTPSVKVSVSIGVCLCPRYANTGKAMLKCADKALTAVKQQGKKQYRFYEDADCNKE